MPPSGSCNLSDGGSRFYQLRFLFLQTPHKKDKNYF